MLDRERLTSLLRDEQERFVRDHPRSEELAEQASHSLLAGVPMPWMTRWAGAFPVFVDRAEGARFVDVDGHEYVDLCLGDTGSISFGKRIGEGTSLAVDRLTSVTVQEGLLATLAQVRVALGKIEDGSYGTCEVCGEAIGEERLEVRPWAVRCVADS